MGLRNYLIDGLSGTGKTSVATELQRRGYHVIHGDRELAYKGNPKTGAPLDLAVHRLDMTDPHFVQRHHLWDRAKLESLVFDRSHPVTFFCGGSRNWRDFIALFDGVFVLRIDSGTLEARLSERPEDEFGGKPAERAMILQLQKVEDELPGDATVIDATDPLDVVVDALLATCGMGS